MDSSEWGLVANQGKLKGFLLFSTIREDQYLIQYRILILKAPSASDCGH